MNSIRYLTQITFLIFTLILIFTIVIAILTYILQPHQTQNIFLHFAISHHLTIMIIMVCVSISFGFYWSIIANNRLIDSQMKTKNIERFMKLFLSQEEEQIIQFLKEKPAFQSQIAKINAMGRVKAHRLIQKLLQKNLVRIEDFGKQKKIYLDESGTQILR